MTERYGVPVQRINNHSCLQGCASVWGTLRTQIEGEAFVEWIGSEGLATSNELQVV